MSQADLFMSAAAEDGAAAARACAAKAVRVAAFDVAGAGRFMCGWLERYGAQSGEALVNAAKAHGFRPHDDRAFGAVFKVLRKQDRIRQVGTCLREKGHAGSGGRVWALQIRRD